MFTLCFPSAGCFLAWQEMTWEQLREVKLGNSPLINQGEVWGDTFEVISRQGYLEIRLSCKTYFKAFGTLSTGQSHTNIPFHVSFNKILWLFPPSAAASLYPSGHWGDSRGLCHDPIKTQCSFLRESCIPKVWGSSEEFGIPTKTVLYPTNSTDAAGTLLLMRFVSCRN